MINKYILMTVFKFDYLLRVNGDLHILEINYIFTMWII